MTETSPQQCHADAYAGRRFKRADGSDDAVSLARQRNMNTPPRLFHDADVCRRYRLAP